MTQSTLTGNFTVLMPVYAGDDEQFARAAFASATADQQLPPRHVVIVRDGPVGDGIAAWLDEVNGHHGVEVVPLGENHGLASALNIGLKHAPTEIVARMDADDISLPNRFAIQIPMIEQGLDIVGSAIAEFSDDPNRADVVRHAPLTQDQIEQQARLTCPFHHPSVVFRKQAVLAAGGYPHLRNMEDYLLWARMLMKGARAANAAEVLVHYRVGAGAFSRRGGRILARSEAIMQKEFRAMGFTTTRQYLRNRVLRGPVYRHMPSSVRKVAYHLWEKVKPSHAGPDHA